MNTLLSFSLSAPQSQIIVLSVAYLFCQSFTLWSSSKPGILWLSCVGPCYPTLCVATPFSVHQPPNLTSCLQIEELTPCFKLILSVALVGALGSLSMTLTHAVDGEMGSLNASRSRPSQTFQHFYLCTSS